MKIPEIQQEAIVSRRSRTFSATLCLSLKTAEPATKAFAPAAITSLTVLTLTPPSTSKSADEPQISSMTRNFWIFSVQDEIYDYPPNPGLTDITSTRSISEIISSRLLTGVAGLILTPALTPNL